MLRVQSFDYFETENEEFLRLQSLADPRVSVSKLISAVQQCPISNVSTTCGRTHVEPTYFTSHIMLVHHRVRSTVSYTN